MRAHLVDCADCRATTNGTFGWPRRSAGGAARERAAGARASAWRRARPARRPARWLALAATAAPAPSCCWLVRRAARPRTRSRGAAAAPGSQLLVYEVAEGAALAQPVGAELRAGSGLAFAYANISTSGA